MALSYSLRAVCVALIGLGSIQILAEFSLWLLSPQIAGLFQGDTRKQARLIFYAQLTTHLCAALFTALLLVPHYLGTESNLAAERIGIVSVAAAALIIWRYARALFSGLQMWARSVRLQRIIVGAGPTGHEDAPVPFIHPHADFPPLALVGLWRPCIVATRSFLNASGMTRETLAVALDHERAHLRHRDNWKLFLLNCLPSLNAQTKTRPACIHLWLRYSDWAADDDAVRGNHSRAITLAECLLTCAKSISADKTKYLLTGLATHEQELKTRIERLLAPSQRKPVLRKRRALFALAAVAFFIGFISLLVLEPWLNVVAEAALHLG